jgi:hypothetical protein
MVGGTTAAQAAVQAQHQITAAAHHLQIVRHLQHGPALLAAQFQQQLLELLAAGPAWASSSTSNWRGRTTQKASSTRLS